jgi:hypothetical protein
MKVGALDDPECFACGKQAKSWGRADGLQGHGIAAISIEGQVDHVFLCEACFESDETTNVLTRKILNAPDLKISEGGEVTRERFADIAAAISEKNCATEH